MGPMGFEPMTIRLKAECSTTELRTHLYYNCPLIKAQIRIKLKLNYGNILKGKEKKISFFYYE